ncbi:MAG: hypothetical protein IKT22_09235 [Prevotella sp.]|nr:hypothetical protein [Prevotella sp.]
MTTMQMNTAIFRELSQMQNDEVLLGRALKSLRRVRRERKKEFAADPTLMTKEEFFRRIDEAEAQYERGEYTELLPGEDLTAHLRRVGYDI